MHIVYLFLLYLATAKLTELFYSLWFLLFEVRMNSVGSVNFTMICTIDNEMVEHLRHKRAT